MKNIGIIGVGIIASAVVEGFCTAENDEELHFFLCPRNKEKTAHLKSMFPDQITVCNTNQEAVDSSDVIFVSLLGKHAESALKEMEFKQEQMIISVMSDHPVSSLSEWIKPARKLVRMVPLPLVTTHKGPIVCYPKDEAAASLFAPLGEVIGLKDENELIVVTAITGLMSTYYLMLHTVARSAAEYGLSEEVSMNFTSLFFNALSDKAVTVGIDGAKALAYDEMTPGGLNELALLSNVDNGTYENLKVSFEKIMERMLKK